MQHLCQPLARRARAAFTLLELMVAIAIAGFTVAALYGLFSVQSRQFVTQDLHMEMNQNLRFATDMVSRSVRMAGYGTSVYVTGAMGSGSSADTLPAIVSWDSDGSNNTDAITVVYQDPSLVMDTSAGTVEQCGTTTLTFLTGRLDYSSKMSQYSANELLLCFDYADIRAMESYMWVLASAPDTSTGEVSVASNSGYSDFSSLCGGSENLTPVMTCSKGNVYTFYIDDTDDGVGPGSAEHPVLMLDMDYDWPEADDVPLVDNIEDLQLEYCLDDGTNSVDCSDSTQWVDSFDTDDAELVYMVRVSLVGRSSRPDLRDIYPGSRPALGNRSAGTGTDNYFRQVVSTEIAVRNIHYLANL